MTTQILVTLILLVPAMFWLTGGLSKLSLLPGKLRFCTASITCFLVPFEHTHLLIACSWLQLIRQQQSRRVAPSDSQFVDSFATVAAMLLTCIANSVFTVHVLCTAISYTAMLYTSSDSSKKNVGDIDSE